MNVKINLLLALVVRIFVFRRVNSISFTFETDIEDDSFGLELVNILLAICCLAEEG